MGYINIADQTVTFLYALALGAIFCVLYDIFRFFHKNTKSWLWVFITDIAYWLLLTLVSFCFFVLRTKGLIRGYALLGEALGFVLCKLIFADRILYLFLWIQKVLRWIFELVCRPLEVILRFLRQICKKIRMITKKVLKKPRELLYNTHDTKKQDVLNME